MEVTSKYPSSIKTDFQDFLFFNKYTNPRPEFMHSPVNKAPNGIPPAINTSHNKTDEAQLGIIPIIADKIGVKYGFEDKKLTILFSPIK